MKIVFAKLHCEQSDYLIANTALPQNAQKLSQSLCSRRTGAGADGMVFLQKAGENYFAQQFNPDGSAAALCDTALRCTARYLALKNAKEDCFTINGLRAKVLSADLIETFIENITFQPESILPLKIKQPLINALCEICGEGVRLTALQCGIPYAAVFCTSLNHIDACAKGGLFQNSRTFQNGINVIFIQIVDKNCLRLKVFRSGCGEVPSCSNAAAAAAFAANKLQLCKSEINAVFGSGAMKVMLKEESAVITAAAYYIGNFEYKE